MIPTCLKLTIIVLLLVVISSSMVIAYKILLMPVQQKSHIACMVSIADELDRRGHDVHVLQLDKFSIPLTPRAKGSKVKKYTFQLNKHVAVDVSMGDLESRMEEFVRALVDTKASFRDMIDMVNKNSVKSCEMIALNTDESFRKLSEGGFDLAIVDGSPFSKCYYLIPHRVGIPWITYTDYPEQWLIRLPWLPSFIPHHFSTFTERMTFTERTKNTLLSIYLYFYTPRVYVPENILTMYRGFGAFDTLEDLISRSKLFLVTNDLVLDYVKPSMPNVIEVGGLTTTEPNTLPDDIQRFMDDADKGVIVVSFGTMLSKFPLEIADKFTSVFRRLDGYRVIWRMINVDNSTALPSNVKIASWLPQNDVLAHPKTKLFITHCGNNGQFEAVYNKVPMIGFPILGDQKYNSIRLEHKGYGLAMNMFEFTAEQLFSNIQRMLTDREYANRVSRASEIFKSAAEKPAERAARWVEHVMEFGGNHLRSAGSDLSLYQYLMLDVLATFVASFVVLAVVLYKIVKFIVRKCRVIGKRSQVRPITQHRKGQ